MRLVFICFLCFITVVAQAQTYAIGHRTLDLVDASRSDRAVPTEVFYPADVSGDNVAVADGAFPVVVVGHGFFMDYAAYQYLWETLVPEGYVVAVLKTEGSLSPSHENFGLDLAFVIADLKLSGTVSGNNFYQHIGTTSAIMGHSMGGGASFLGMAAAATVTTMAVFAPAETTPSAIAAAANIAASALIITGSLDCIAPTAEHGQPIFDALGSDCKFMADITGGSHCQFANSNFACEFGEFTCPTAATISRDQQHNLQFGLVLPWLRYHLYNDATAWGDFVAATENDSLSVQSNCVQSGISVLNQAQIKVWPNPMTGRTLQVALPIAASCEVTLYDIFGRVVSKYSRQSGAIALDLPLLPSGLYKLQVVYGGRSEAVTVSVFAE